MLTLEAILEEYYKENQLSKSMNMLDIIKPDAGEWSIRPIKCVCEVFSPKEGWGKDVEKAGAEHTRCFYCKNEIKKLFPDFKGKLNILSIPMPEEANCIYCYKFMGSIYRTGEGLLVLKNGSRQKRGKEKCLNR